MQWYSSQCSVLTVPSGKNHKGGRSQRGMKRRGGSPKEAVDVSKTVTEWEKRSGGRSWVPIALFLCAFRKKGDGGKKSFDISHQKDFFRLMQKRFTVHLWKMETHWPNKLDSQDGCFTPTTSSWFPQKCAETWLVAKRYMLTDEEAKIFLGHEKTPLTQTPIWTCQVVRCHVGSTSSGGRGWVPITLFSRRFLEYCIGKKDDLTSFYAHCFLSEKTKHLIIV